MSSHYTLVFKEQTSNHYYPIHNIYIDQHSCFISSKFLF